MQELRIVAVSEDGSYAVLAVPGRGGRFSLPIDDRLRIVARGQFSRLAQYEIEVESPLRPKEIQDRIRAGETAEDIADAAGVPIERVRRFEGPVLAERAYRAQEAQSATIRRPGDSGPGPRLGDIVAERLTLLGIDPEEVAWDSRKLGDSTWHVQLVFAVGGRPHRAEWSFDPRRRHVSPASEEAARLSLPEADLSPLLPSRPEPRATVTQIASRLSHPTSQAPTPAASPSLAPPGPAGTVPPSPAQGTAVAPRPGPAPSPAPVHAPAPPPTRPCPPRRRPGAARPSPPSVPRARLSRRPPRWTGRPPRSRIARPRPRRPAGTARSSRPRSRGAAVAARPRAAGRGVPRCRPGTRSCSARHGSLTDRA
jgi:hypothetical protein